MKLEMWFPPRLGVPLGAILFVCAYDFPLAVMNDLPCQRASKAAAAEMLLCVS